MDCTTTYDMRATLIENFENKLSRIKNGGKLVEFLKDSETINSLINTLSNNNIKRLLNSIDSLEEIKAFCENMKLIDYVLEHYLIDKTLAEKFNAILLSASSSKVDNVSNIFELFDLQLNKALVQKKLKSYDVERIRELNKYNSKLYLYNVFTFTFEEKLEVAQLFEKSQEALKRLDYILNNKLESTFDVESLKKYLSATSDAKKSRI